jgi:hypothetical protein
MALEAQIASLQADFESEVSEAVKRLEIEQDMIKQLEQDRIEMAESRKADRIHAETDNLNE